MIDYCVAKITKLEHKNSTAIAESEQQTNTFMNKLRSQISFKLATGMHTIRSVMYNTHHGWNILPIASKSRNIQISTNTPRDQNNTRPNRH